jgi:hypothetical protein
MRFGRVTTSARIARLPAGPTILASAMIRTIFRGFSIGPQRHVGGSLRAGGLVDPPADHPTGAGAARSLAGIEQRPGGCCCCCWRWRWRCCGDQVRDGEHRVESYVDRPPPRGVGRLGKASSGAPQLKRARRPPPRRASPCMAIRWARRRIHPAATWRHGVCEPRSDVSEAVCALATAPRMVRWMLSAPISSSMPVLRISSMCSFPTFTRRTLMLSSRSSR